MVQRLQRHAAWFTGWLLVSLLGCWLLAQSELTRLHEAFDADTRIALRLLNQRVAQHDAMLSTLTLLRPAAEQMRSQQRLPPVYPQVLAVQRRGEDEVWNASLQAAEAESRRLHRAVLTEVNFAKGRYGMVLAGEPASYALLIDVRTMVPWGEWPMTPDVSPIRMTLGYEGQTFVLQPGGLRDSDASGWRFEFHSPLGADSQPFTLAAERRVAWSELPWARMTSWSLLMAVLLLGSRALLRQRKDRRRAQELLHLGQVARINTLGDLASGMAHEMHEPLTSMLINAQVASRVLEQTEPDLLTAQLAVKEVVAQARRASAVVRRMRQAVAQPDRGAQIQEMDLQGAARKAIDLLDAELRHRSIASEIVLSGPAFTVRAEPNALEQIVHNLLMNAMQAMEQVPAGERRLVLALGVDEGVGQLRVHDSGPGMQPEALQHVFDPFFTTHDSSLGLGLSQSEALARGMGGTLTARNHPLRGAEFCLTLPLASLQ
ncbi:MAG: ATP-binding protein [Burkholderiaceae bacterium]